MNKAITLLAGLALLVGVGSAPTGAALPQGPGSLDNLTMASVEPRDHCSICGKSKGCSGHTGWFEDRYCTGCGVRLDGDHHCVILGVRSEPEPDPKQCER